MQILQLLETMQCSYDACMLMLMRQHPLYSWSLMHILVGIFILFGVLAPLVASGLCGCCVYLV